MKQLTTTIYMPNGKGGTMPAPYLLTQEETARMLRIDDKGDITKALARYHDRGLRPVRAGRTNKYSLPTVVAFINERAAD